MAEPIENAHLHNCPDCHIPLKKGKDKWFCPECGQAPSFSCASQMPDKANVAEDARLSFPLKIEELPSVLAIPLDLYLKEDKNAVMRLHRICDAVEVLVKFIALAGIFEYREYLKGGPFPESFLKEIQERICHPTLGMWSGILEEVKRSYSSISDPIFPEIPEYIESVILPYLGKAGDPNEEKILPLRNLLAHGGGMLSTVAEDFLYKFKHEERFIKIWSQANFLMQCRICFKDKDRSGLLIGPETTLTDRVLDLAENGIYIRRDKSNKTISIIPLLDYAKGRVIRPAGAKTSGAESPLIFARAEADRLFMAALGGSVPLSENTDHAGKFIKLFSLESRMKKKVLSLDFEEEIKIDSESFRGRENHLKVAAEKILPAQTGIFWLSGPGGMGKSMFMSQLASNRQFTGNPKNCLRLAFKFKANDARCSTKSFYKYAISVFMKHFKDEKELSEDVKELEDKFKEYLAKFAALKPASNYENVRAPRVIIFMDGIDELRRFERDACAMPFRFQYENVIWVCAGRGEDGLNEIYDPRRCSWLFEGTGLPGMNADDIRGLLIEGLEAKKYDLIGIDEESIRGEKKEVSNRFIGELVEKADGMPLYIKLVIDDIVAGEITLGPNQKDFKLPGKLSDYYDMLLDRLGIGDLKATLSPLVFAIAWAKGPMTEESLYRLLNKWGLIADDQASRELVAKAIIFAATMLKPAPTWDGKNGYVIYHETFQAHIRNSDEGKVISGRAKAAFCKMTEKWAGLPDGDARNYVLKYGLKHLIDAGKWDDVEKILTDLNFIDAKCVAGMTYELVEDYKEAIENLPDEDAREKIKNEKEHQEKIKKYVDDLIKYSGDPDNNPLPHIDSVKIMTDEEIDAKIERIKNSKNLTRLEKIEEYARFVNSSAHELVKFAVNNPKFCIQQAYNSAEGGMVADAAEAIIRKIKHTPFIMQKKESRGPYNPCPALLKTFEGHTDFVRSVAITSDGKTAVAGSWDNTLRVWDIANGKCLWTHKANTLNVVSVAITPDGHIAVSGSVGNKLNVLHVWDIASGKCLRTFEGHTSVVNSVAITSDGRIAVSGSHDNTLRVWDIASGKCLWTLEGHTNNVEAVAITPDGHIAVSGSFDETIRIWDITSGKCLRTLEDNTGCFNTVSITSDGRTVVSGSHDNTLRVWDIASGKCLKTFGGLNTVTITSDGRTAVSWKDDNTIRVWDIASGKCLKTLGGHNGGVCSAAITPDGRTVVSGSHDNTLRVWNIASGKYLSTIVNFKSWVRTVTVTFDGRTAVSGSYNTLRTWDITSGKCLRMIEDHTDNVNAVTITPDGRTAVSWSFKTLHVWDIVKGKCLKILEGHTNGVNSVAITPDGKTTVSGSKDNTIRVWDIASGKCLKTLGGHNNYVCSVAITPDGRTVVSGSHDNTLRVWDIASGKCLWTLEGHTNYVTDVIIAPDGKTAVSGSWDKNLKVWDISSGRCLWTLKGHASWVNAVAITPDGRTAVSRSQNKTLRVWDISSGRCLRMLKGHTNVVNAMVVVPDVLNVVDITPDGRTVVSGGEDKTLRVWDIASGKCHAIVALSSSVYCAAITGNSFVAGEESGKVNFFDLINIYFAPPILTAWHNSADDTHAFGCTHCRKWSEISPAMLGTEIDCPKCGRRVKLNPFTIEGDWREIERAWGGE